LSDVPQREELFRDVESRQPRQAAERRLHVHHRRHHAKPVRQAAHVLQERGRSSGGYFNLHHLQRILENIPIRFISVLSDYTK
jgi:hypothetical protein